MTEKMSKKIVAQFEKYDYIDKRDRAVYEYGMEVCMFNGLLLLWLFILSLLGGYVEAYVFFVLFFLPLRRYSGGYHADREWKCVILSTLFYGTYLLLVSWTNRYMGNNILYFGLILCDVIILKKTPLMMNKDRLDNQQIKTNRKKSCLMLATMNVLLLGMLKIDWMLSTCIYVVIILTTINLCLMKGKKENERTYNERNN